MTKAVLAAWALALIVVAVRRPDRLLAAAILCAPFEGAALLNAGGVGVSPYFFVLMLIAARLPFVRTEASRLLGTTSPVRAATLAALVLLAVGVVGAFVLPVAFAGTPVNSPRLNADATAPLIFSTSNVGQCIYLGLNAVFLWYAGQAMGTPDVARSAVAAISGAGAIVIGFAFYQLASALAGVPYPSDVLYSNDAFVMQHGSTILDMPRIGSTFTEPAGMAVFLVGFLGFAIVQLAAGGRGTGWRLALVLGGIAAVAISTSSTGFVGLAGLAAWAGVAFVAVPIARGTARPRVVIAAVVLLAIVVGAIAVSEPLRDVIQAMVFDKGDSDSFEGRSSADALAIGLARQTLGLGVGLGSNRASSFVPSMLSTIGVPGLAALLLCFAHLARRVEGDAEIDAWRRAAAVGLLATVAVKCVSSPDLVTPLMWCFAAALIAIHGAAASTEADDDHRLTDQKPAVGRRRALAMSAGGEA